MDVGLRRYLGLFVLEARLGALPPVGKPPAVVPHLRVDVSVARQVVIIYKCVQTDTLESYVMGDGAVQQWNHSIVGKSILCYATSEVGMAIVKCRHDHA